MQRCFLMQASGYREQANKCRRLAAASDSYGMRKELLTTANLFDALADTCEVQDKGADARRRRPRESEADRPAR
jgi:hypothetical protein